MVLSLVERWGFNNNWKNQLLIWIAYARLVLAMVDLRNQHLTNIEGKYRETRDSKKLARNELYYIKRLMQFIEIWSNWE